MEKYGKIFKVNVSNAHGGVFTFKFINVSNRIIEGIRLGRKIAFACPQLRHKKT